MKAWGVDLNAVDAWQQNAAHLAAKGGHLDMLRELEVRVGFPEYLGTSL